MSVPETPIVALRNGVVFDMDGLMLDTESIARICWRRAFREMGHGMSDEFFGSMIGRNKKDCGGLLRAEFGDNFDVETCYTRCGIFYEEYIEERGIPLKAGVEKLLEELFAEGVPLAVATSTRNPTARERLTQVGLIRFFSVVVGGNEVAQGKPAPDIYLEAVRRLGIDAASSFALEDSYAGVKAAHAAGLKVIMVPDLLPATDAMTKIAHRVLPSLDQVSIYFSDRNLFQQA